MKDIEQLLETALTLERAGDKEEALETLSRAFGLLVDESGVYAREKEKHVTDMDELRAIAPRLVEHSKEYLRRNLTAAMILNNMGLLFMELEQYDAAKQKFDESMDLTPADTEYDDPSENLNHLIAKIAELNALTEEGSYDD